MAIRRELSEKLLRTTPLRVSLAAATQREAERETFALEDAEGRGCGRGFRPRPEVGTVDATGMDVQGVEKEIRTPS